VEKTAPSHVVQKRPNQVVVQNPVTLPVVPNPTQQLLPKVVAGRRQALQLNRYLLLQGENGLSKKHNYCPV
jgi:hypothetical protein